MVSKELERKMVLGTGVDLIDKEKVIEMMSEWIEGNKTKHLVTAYSEFFVRAKKDEKFRKSLMKADLVVPDGVSVLAAISYKHKILKIKKQILNIPEKDQSNNNFINEFIRYRVLTFAKKIKLELLAVVYGLQTGWEILFCGIGQTVTGVWLTGEILRLAHEKGWRVFLLGGYGITAKQLMLKVKAQMSKAEVMADVGVGDVENTSEEDHLKVINKINEFNPDVLLVAYGPVKQEKWIYQYKEKLNAKILIGVGGTFDELTGKVKPVPEWMSRSGLKWLWRLLIQPQRWRRIWVAVAVFPWMVWKERWKQNNNQ